MELLVLIVVLVLLGFAALWFGTDSRDDAPNWP